VLEAYGNRYAVHPFVERHADEKEKTMSESPDPFAPPEPVAPDIPDVGPSPDVPVGPPDVGPSPEAPR
jgi:hypothetical protein